MPTRLIQQFARAVRGKKKKAPKTTQAGTPAHCSRMKTVEKRVRRVRSPPLRGHRRASWIFQLETCVLPQPARASQSQPEHLHFCRIVPLPWPRGSLRCVRFVLAGWLWSDRCEKINHLRAYYFKRRFQEQDNFCEVLQLLLGFTC